MGVDQDIDIGSGGFTDQRSQLGSLALVAPGHAAVEVAVALFAGPAVLTALLPLIGKGIELEGGVTGIDDRPDLRNDTLAAGELRLVGMGIERDLVADGPAQELVDRLAEDFAANIPERDIDGTGAFDAGS